MEKLNEWLSENKGADLAAGLGVTKAYVTQLKKGLKIPSLRRAVQIEDLTGGAVPVRSWVE